MKLRTKMILGFLVLVLVFSTAIGISLFALSDATKGFSEYRGLARDTNLSGRLQANMLMVRMNVKDFIITHSERDIEQYSEYFALMREFMDTAQAEIMDPERARLVDEADEKVTEYNRNFEQLKEHAATVDREVAGTMDVIGPQMERNLTAILVSAEEDGDMTAAYNASLALRSLLLGRLYVTKFLKNNLQAEVDRVEEEFASLDSYLDTLNAELQNPERRGLLDEIHNADETYIESFRIAADTTFALNDIVQNRLDVLGPQIAEDVENVKLSVMADQDELGPRLQANNERSVLLISILTVAALILAVVIILITTNSVLKQLGADPGVIEQIMSRVSAGDLAVQAGDFNLTRVEGVFSSVMEMVGALQDKADSLGTIASGDFTGNITKASDKDSLGISMLTMQESLTGVLNQVKQAIEQVAQGSDQVSQASQSLSQGATEQASSLEEISSSITEINGQANQNAMSASEANKLAVEARDNALSGNNSMEELISAMEEINIGSGEIKKVVKVIDDIAFQINLLALNANVEAARAGKYGRGFAVVAEEVRNLAARSAEAVKETTTIVDQSVSSIEHGDKLVKDTASQLELIVDGAGKVASLLDEISAASREQAQGLSQISEGVEQIDEVTQANTASAEESASAAEELAGQGDELRRLIAQFKLASETRLLGYTSGNNGNGNTRARELETVGIGGPSTGDTVMIDDDDFDRF